MKCDKARYKDYVEAEHWNYHVVGVTKWVVSARYTDQETVASSHIRLIILSLELRLRCTLH